MVEKIFEGLDECFRFDEARGKTTYYFSIGDVKRTITVGMDSCKVENGKTVESADCVCKMVPELFLRVWNEGYRPGMKDFLSGAIRSNDPHKLTAFLQAFGRGA